MKSLSEFRQSIQCVTILRCPESIGESLSSKFFAFFFALIACTDVHLIHALQAWLMTVMNDIVAANSTHIRWLTK